MAGNFELSATKRDTFGKGHTNRLRRLQGLMPAIIYGGDNSPSSINISHNLILKAIKNEAFFSHILTIDVEGKKEQVVIKDMHRHPYKKEILHMDFLRIKDKEAIVMKVPLHFTGEELAPGVKNGGAVSHLMTEVEIKCLPKDLPEFIKVDISKLELDQSIHLAELYIPKTIQIVHLTHGEDSNLPVVSIHKIKVKTVTDEQDVSGDTDTNTDTTEETEKKPENS